MKEEYCRKPQAALILHVSLSKLSKMDMRNEIKRYKVGRINLYKISDLEEYINNHAINTIDPLRDMADNRLCQANKRKGGEREKNDTDDGAETV